MRPVFVPRLCLVFAFCDALTIALHGIPAVAHAVPYFAASEGWPPLVLGIEAARVLLALSLIPSTLGLAKGLVRGAAWSWIQLPLRLAFAALGESQYLSFAPLRIVTALCPPTAEWAYYFLIAAAALEILRPPLATWLLWPSRPRRQPRRLITLV